MISGNTLLHAYRPAALLRVTGEDAFTFLQGQFSNDLRPPAGSATYGLWLDHKGKVMADSQVLRLKENEFLLASVTSPVAVLRARLEAYIVADDVVLQDETATAHGLALAGPGGAEAVRQLFGQTPGAGQFVQSGEARAFPSRRTRMENFEIIRAEGNMTKLKRQLVAQGCSEAGLADMELARITEGLPAIPQDLGPGDLPSEGGLEETALSYTKGCYLGQEVMARLKNLGKVRRRLHVVRGTGEPPRPAAPLYQGEKKMGEIRSSVRQGDGFAALAMLALINLDPRARLSLSPRETPVINIEPHG